MRNWIIFGLALTCVIVMLYAGIDALSQNQSRTGLFLTFVGSMTVVGLAIDLVNHVRTRRWM